MTRFVCDLVNVYPKEADGPTYPITAEELKVLNSRYECYEKELDQKKDRVYCENSTTDNVEFMTCLKTNNIEIYPDDIIHDYKFSKDNLQRFYPIGWNPEIQEKLTKLNVKKDVSVCYTGMFEHYTELLIGMPNPIPFDWNKFDACV